MDIDHQYMAAFFRFRSAIKSFRGAINARLDGLDIGIADIALLKAIADNAIDSDENVNITDIQDYLLVTKGAVSQMLGALEKKGYLSRQIDKNNRRKLIITLTSSGKEILREMEGRINTLLSEIISHIGEDETVQIIGFINRIADAAEKFENIVKATKEGE